MKKPSSLRVIGQRIREARKFKGFSQEQLALEADMDRSYVGQVERGEQNATVTTLAKLARATGCDIGAFCKGLPLPGEKL